MLNAAQQQGFEALRQGMAPSANQQAELHSLWEKAPGYVPAHRGGWGEVPAAPAADAAGGFRSGPLALGAAQAAGADIGISVTGVAGPTGGDAVRPVGTVYLGAARGDTVYVEKLFVSRPDRALIRARAAQEALVLALRRAQDKVPAATKPLAAADCRDAAALEALNAAFLAE